MTEIRPSYVVGRCANGGPPASADARDFPGCHGVPMTEEEVARPDDGRHIEYWDARGVAWMVRDVSAAHERPIHRLAALLERIAQARGAPIECYGTMTFCERGPQGDRIRSMEADQTVYLNAPRAQALRSPVVVLGDVAPPDVVLEVDHTTDVRRRKLSEYEKWRFPEIWVEVPPACRQGEPGRRRRRRPPGLTIHALDGKTKRFQEAPASKALPGWTAEEIHRAMNEPLLSRPTAAALQRVGRALGRKEGTAPTDDPLLDGLLRETRAEAGAKATAAAVRQILAQRGIACSPDFLVDRRRLQARGQEHAIAAALACESEADFVARLQSL